MRGPREATRSDCLVYVESSGLVTAHMTTWPDSHLSLPLQLVRASGLHVLFRPLCTLESVQSFLEKRKRPDVAAALKAKRSPPRDRLAEVQ